MRIAYFFISLFVIISCVEKQKTDTVMTPKIDTTSVAKIIAIDSTYFYHKKYDSIVESFYRTTNFNTVWIGSKKRKKLIDLLGQVEQEGLFKRDFDLKEIRKKEKQFAQLSEKELIDYDLLLTQNLYNYVNKVAVGSVKPKDLYDNWDLKENEVDLIQLLLNFQQKEFFEEAVKEVRPKHIVYHRLVTALKRINKLPKDNFKKLEIKNKIVLNDTNEVVLNVKKRLVYWGDLKLVDSLTLVYDSITALAVKKFQIRHGLGVDGIVGKETVYALNITKQQRKEQIIANLERWRWYPRNFEEEYLIINIPDYSLHCIKKSDTTRTHKIIVGRPDRMTPVLSSKLTHLIYNPTWTVPPTILRKDVIPATRRDRSYLSRKKISLFDASGNRVGIDNWTPQNAYTFRYVQSPGIYNSMGQVKFMFPNRFSIYLHDTNTRGFFIQDIRALSSGCIRVQNPFELTEYLLDDSENWSLEKIEEAINTGKTKAVNFNKDIFIHVLYWTAWSEKGTLHFRDDLYHLDTELYQKLRRH